MEKLLGAKDVCELLGVAERTLYIWTHLRKIPFLKVGGLLRFRASELEKWLENQNGGTPKLLPVGTDKPKRKAHQPLRKKSNSRVDAMVREAIASNK